MKKFGSNDVVFARAMAMGCEVLNVRISGVSSQESLMQVVKEQLGTFMGMVSLNVRNLTQGWAHTQYYHVA